MLTAPPVRSERAITESTVVSLNCSSNRVSRVNVKRASRHSPVRAYAEKTKKWHNVLLVAWLLAALASCWLLIRPLQRIIVSWLQFACLAARSAPMFSGACVPRQTKKKTPTLWDCGRTKGVFSSSIFQKKREKENKTNVDYRSTINILLRECTQIESLDPARDLCYRSHNAGKSTTLLLSPWSPVVRTFQRKRSKQIRSRPHLSAENSGAVSVRRSGFRIP